MEWQLPIYAHIPLIHGEDGKKLSKRHGATSIEEYQQIDILPVQCGIIWLDWVRSW